jgi:hypothetical protein
LTGGERRLIWDGEHSVENRAMPGRRSAALLLLAGFALAGCENLPYYDESLDLFSRSRYDPTIEAIEERTPPPQDSPVLSAPPDDAAMVVPGPGRALWSAAPPRIDDPIAVDPPGWRPAISERTGAGEAAAPAHEVVGASLPPRTRITPPMGFARSKRVIYGDNRGPFQTGDVRTLR